MIELQLNAGSTEWTTVPNDSWTVTTFCVGHLDPAPRKLPPCVAQSAGLRSPQIFGPKQHAPSLDEQNFAMWVPQIDAFTTEAEEYSFESQKHWSVGSTAFPE